ncbi:MAG: amidohydrolase family protein, partial [Jatrophihabitantaceae bacterium]
MRTLYRNARLFAPTVPGATAMLVDGGTIAWTGRADGAEQHADLRVVDLDGALVTPAFVDAHIHATATGLSLS